MKGPLKFSIITPSYNQGQFIEDTILSVMKQNYKNFEHIIIDGGSNDKTIEILKKYSHLRWISEKDKGQSNAINKGFRMAEGDILAWINSDDYYEQNIFSDIVSFFQLNNECNFLYGDIVYVDRDKNFLYKLTGRNLTYKNLLRNPDIVRQPSCFWRREILHEVGFLDESLQVVMDFDFFLRIAKKFDPYYINKNLSYYRSHNENKTNKLMRKQVSELYRVVRHQKEGISLKFYKYLFGRYVDSLDKRNVFRKLVTPLRKGTK